MSFKGHETAFVVDYEGWIVRGVVIHGGHLDGYGPTKPEVIIEEVAGQEDPAMNVRTFDNWLKDHPKRGLEQRRMVAEMEERVIAEVCKPRDPEDELASRGDYERAERKDEG